MPHPVYYRCGWSCGFAGDGGRVDGPVAMVEGQTMSSVVVVVVILYCAFVEICLFQDPRAIFNLGQSVSTYYTY